MFLTEDGRLLKLSKNGTTMVPVEEPKQTPAQPHRVKAEKELENKIKELQIIEKPPPVEEAPSPPRNEEIKKSYPIKKHVVTRIENIISAINRDNKKDPQEKYKCVSKALMKELSLSLKLLNMLGSNQEIFSPSSEDSPDSDETQQYVVPEILVSQDSPRVGAMDGCNQSDTDRFLSKRVESRYTAQRAGKLAWHWGDGAVISGACDATRQIETVVGPSGRREGLIGSIIQGGRNSRPWRKNGVSGLLGFRKDQDPTGIRLLHNIYKPEVGSKDIGNQKNYSKYPYLNNQSTPKPEYQNNINVRSERNNLEAEKRNHSIKNQYKRDVLFKSEYTRNAPNCKGKINRWKSRDLKTNGTFRTLSLPDFNRILSLSVQGLRKAKSCGDRSFRAMSSNSFSISLKSLFDREQVYNLSGSHKQNLCNTRPKDGATLVKLTHYGSDRDNRNILPGMKSVDQWKQYWEEKHTENSDTEFGKGCSLELTGIVDRGKAIFEGTSATEIPDIKLFDESKEQKNPYKEMDDLENANEIQNSLAGLRELQKSPCVLTPSPVSNKTAFQKAKDMFEGNYNPKETNEEKDNRRKSISERFHVSSLSRDIQSGATPKLLGVPNRLPAVASLGSVYQSQYPHIPISPSRPRYYSTETDHHLFPSWDIVLHSDPNYV
uniref:Unkown protein n=1 Tax=Riptortus pedestris TaxID=329032 RepID=R4WE08_RIPPE|nr:unkown protein [Riptortus pedestris]